MKVLRSCLHEWSGPFLTGWYCTCSALDELWTLTIPSSQWFLAWGDHENWFTWNLVKHPFLGTMASPIWTCICPFSKPSKLAQVGAFPFIFRVYTISEITYITGREKHCLLSMQAFVCWSICGPVVLGAAVHSAELCPLYVPGSKGFRFKS